MDTNTETSRPRTLTPTTLKDWALRYGIGDVLHYTKFQADKGVMVAIPLYRDVQIKRIYFRSWQVNESGQLFLKFSLRAKKGIEFIQAVDKISFVR